MLRRKQTSTLEEAIQDLRDKRQAEKSGKQFLTEGQSMKRLRQVLFPDDSALNIGEPDADLDLSATEEARSPVKPF